MSSAASPAAAPGRAPRRARLSAVAGSCAVAFVALGVVAVIIGGHDVLFAVQLTYRVAGAVVFLVGLGLLASAAGFVRRKAWAYAYAVTSAAALAIVAVLFLSAQWLTGVHGERLLVWVVLAVLALVAAVALAREGRLKPAGFARRRVQVVSSLLSVGAILSVAQFWNGAVRVPPTSAPSLSIASDLAQHPPKNELIPITAHVNVRNSGSSKVWVLGSVYKAWGGSAVPDESSLAEYENLVASEGTNERLFDGVARHADDDYEEVIETGSLLGDLTYLVPGEEYAFKVLLHAPPNTYDAILFEVVVYIAKDTLVLDEAYFPAPEEVDDASGRRLVLVRHVRETSWLAQFMRGRREMRVELALDASQRRPAGGMSVTIDRRGGQSAPDAPEAARMARLYGVAYSDNVAELPLK